MDILHLVDRLETLITQSRLIPLTVYRLVDEDRALELIDQMRISIPEEVRKAKRIHQERDRVMAQAHEESSRLVALAREEAGGLIHRDAVAEAAERRADTIVERAQGDARTIKAGADEYVMQVLSALEEDLLRSMTVVRNGLEKLEEERRKISDMGAEAGVPDKEEGDAG